MLNIPFINKPPVHSAFLSPHSLQFASAYFGVFCALAFAICLFWLVLQARALCSGKGVSGTRNSQKKGSGKGISKKRNFWHGFPNFFGWAEHFGGPEPTPTLLGAILVVGSTLWYQVAGSAWLLHQCRDLAHLRADLPVYNSNAHLRADLAMVGAWPPAGESKGIIA